MIIAGIMTGTSADALDIVLAKIERTINDGELTLHLLAAREIAFAEDLALDILRLLEPVDVPLALVSSVDTRFGQACADAVVSVTEEFGVECDLVVMHGQTVRHDVVDGVVEGTLQIGQPAWIAEATGAPVLSDTRSRDVAAGGQGAPLASTLDQLLSAAREAPTALLNLGGIANITVVAPGQQTVAFDTGPANALIDLMARRITGEPRAIDRGGRFAASGTVVPALLDDLLQEPYYARTAPKSTGKELFNGAYLDSFLARHPDLPANDVVATLTTLTARTVAQACREYGVHTVVAAGGGTRNPVLLDALRHELGEIPVETTDTAFGLPEGAKEACIMALLGWLTWHGLPGTLPSVTGARHATIAGRLTPGARPLQLPRPLANWPTRLRVVTGETS